MKKIISIVISLLLCLNVSFVFAGEPTTLYYNSITASAGESATVNVSIKNNTSMAGLLLNIKYDESRILIENIENGNTFADAMFTIPDLENINSDNSIVSWVSLNGLQGNGKIMTIKIKVLSGVFAEEYPITITGYEASDINENDVHIAIDNGAMPIVTTEVVECSKGENIDVPVIIVNNPGISALSIKLQYDSDALVLNRIENGNLFKTAYFESGEISSDPVSMNWVGLDNFQNNGTIAICNFTVADDVENGEYPIKIEITESINADENDIALYSKNSSIIVNDGNIADVEILDSGTDSNGIQWVLYENGILNISGNGAMADYSITSENPWYSNRLLITEVNINGDITHLAECAFYGCVHLTKITIPSSVNSIGTYTFRNCDEMIIYGEADSFAESYAIENEIPFVNTKNETLKDITVEYLSTTKKMYFDISVEDYSEDATVYIAIYDINGIMLDLISETLLLDDITSLSLIKNTNASYAKVFVWGNGLKPVTKSETISDL